MNSESQHRRISTITTPWSLIVRAHGSDDKAARAAQEQLLAIYGGAIRRYLFALLRGDDAANDLYQEFSIRLVCGAFKKLDPQHGRFRSYVKTVLYHLVKQHYKEQQKRLLLPSSFEVVETTFHHDLDGNLQEQLLSHCSSIMKEAEARGGQPYATVLVLRTQFPQARSNELAQKLSEQLQKPYSSDALRQLLHRAREKFADLLVEEIARTLLDPTLEALREEIIDLKLEGYCSAALERWARNN